MFNKDPLHYHTKVKFDQLLEKREKAFWFEINGVKTSMPKKCCKLLNEDDKTVYIWTKVLESNMMKAREYLKNLKKDKQEKLVNQNDFKLEKNIGIAVGSLRRGNQEIGDVDIIITS